MTKQFAEKTSEREYVALVWGNIEEDEGTVEGNIGRHDTNRMRMAVHESDEKGKHAVTHYKVLERFGYVTLVSCQLETGRTHQIRVHMSYIGYPVYGDPKYGKKKDDQSHGQFLHAKKLGFIHPTTGEYLEFECPLPDYFQAKLDELKGE